jgi:hypothetical protein
MNSLKWVFFKNHNQEMCIEIALKALPYEMQDCMPKKKQHAQNFKDTKVVMKI